MGINFNGGLIHWFNVEYNDGDLMSWMSIRGNMPGYGSNDVGMGLRVYGKDSDVTTGRAGSRPYSWERASIMVSTASHNLEFDNQASGTGVLGAISLGLTNKGVRTEAVRFTATQTTFMGLVTASQAHWEDLRFPAQSINLSGLPAAPGLNTTTYYGALDFDDASLHDIAGMAQMPHGWKNSTSVYPHIHYVNGQDQLATAVWELRYKIANVGEAFPTAYTVATLTETMSPASSTHQLGAFPTIDMTGKSDSCVISWWLRRVGTAAGDTATSAVTLLEFDIHYQNESFGSTSETGDH
jgi:hypothetical protein